MFNTKNLSPAHLAALTSLMLAIPVAVYYLILQSSWGIAVLVLLAVFLFGYVLILYVFEAFINRKIKLIYKFIYQTKASKREEMYYKYILPQKQ